MVLGESIFLPTGELLLAAGYRLTETYRKRLKQLGFTTVHIQVEGTEDVIPENIISDHVQRELDVAVGKTSDSVRSLMRVKRAGLENFRKILRENRKYLNKYIAGAGMNATIESLLDEILNQPSVVVNVSTLQKANADLFSHAVAVTVTALCIGRKYHFSYEELKQLAMGAINFDLGLAALPPELLEKKDNWSPEEFAQYRQHPVYGYLMLSQNPTIAPTSAAIALMHHEHQDGSGYPRSLKGENRPPIKDFSRKRVIHRFAEIVAVADMYDQLTTNRLGPAISVRDAMKKLIGQAGTVLNSDIVKTLTSIVPILPVGARLRIVNAPAAQLIGYYGVVAKINPDNIEEPQIILYETRKKQRIRPIMIDLNKHKGFALELIT
jgi:HD-GYP domain-containing protein (c-di-GMP phosphodiesterase class II)